ncbi:hypothetical protein IWQ57_002968 [Coemansia nantahalensis]|uniref:Uncharacterized protein n=1 Tax=Coemansia nantahalensis TaxID=2789366 RepID=A0ACC1JY18_9FUNG|nr:hypothetical protein IWQ57_002968 [Coemansia nantahalensis]
MPDISSQTGMLGFNLGIMPPVEETSMASNESFDVSVRHSDPSESLQSSEASFSADAGQVQSYANIIDNDDDDDDDDNDDELDEVDGDDDAVTMELTGTVDLGAVHNDDDDDVDEDEDGNEGPDVVAGADLSMAASNDGVSATDSADAVSFFNMLMQSSAADQQTSLLDNIMSQFGQAQLPANTDNTTHSATDADYTRVAMPADDADEEQDATIHHDAADIAVSEAAGTSDYAGDGASSEEDEDVGNDNDDAVTMELTGIVARLPDDPDSDADHDANEHADMFAVASTESQYATPAGLAVGIFEAYRHRQLVPNVAPAVLELAEVPLRFEPLFRKAELKARLEYCSALSGLFEADQAVGQTAAIETSSFEDDASFFGTQNDLLASRQEELLLRVSKAQQRLAQQTPTREASKLSGETAELRTRLLHARKERDAASTTIEQLSTEIRALQATSTSFDRQLSERKSAQQVLLAVNGLQPADMATDCCDFIYDGFSRLHFGGSAEFTSLHPDVDWAAAIRSAIGAPDQTMRQYTIAAMKANAVLKGMLEDVRRVKRHTFVELGCSDGIQVRVQFFSRAHRRRFHLHIPLATVESYSQLHLETEFDWATEVLYGDVDTARLRACLRACRISPSHPVLSIYEHVESSMAAF